MNLAIWYLNTIAPLIEDKQFLVLRNLTNEQLLHLQKMFHLELIDIYDVETKSVVDGVLIYRK